MRPTFDTRDAEIVAARAAMLADNPINVGDFVTFADGITRRVSYIWAWEPDDAKCDKCGDESNSAPDLKCGRSLGLDANGEETLAPYCDGVYRKVRVPQQIQTSDSGSFHLGEGFVSFSGSLYNSVPFETLTDTGDTHDGGVWIFHHGYAQRDNGVEASIKFRVWRCSQPGKDL